MFASLFVLCSCITNAGQQVMTRLFEVIIHWQTKSFVMDQSISRVRVCMAMDAALDATLSIGLSIELMIKKVVIRTAERLQKVRVLRQTSPMHMHVH